MANAAQLVRNTPARSVQTIARAGAILRGQTTATVNAQITVANAQTMASVRTITAVNAATTITVQTIAKTGQATVKIVQTTLKTGQTILKIVTTITGQTADLQKTAAVQGVSAAV